MVVVLILCGVVLCDASNAQDRSPDAPVAVEGTPAPATIEAPTIAQVQERIAQLEADTDLEQAAKEAILTALRQSLEALQRRDVALAEQQQLLDTIAAAPGTLEQLRAELDTPAVAPAIQDFGQLTPDAALEAIRVQLSEAQARLDAAKAEQTRLQNDAVAREARLNEAPGLLVRWREELSEAMTELAAMPTVPADPAATARRWQQQSQAAELAARIARLEAEVANISARREILPIRQSLAQRRAETAQRLVDMLRAADADAASRRARQAQAQAQQQATEVEDDFLRDLARQTGELSAERLGEEGTLAALAQVQAQRSRTLQQYEDLQRRARNTAARVRAAGLNEIVGRSLRNELRRLPELDPNEDNRLTAAIGQSQLRLIDIEEKLADIGDQQSAIARVRQRLGADGQPLSPSVEQQAASIISAYIETLEALRSEYRQYSDEALDLAATRTALRQTTQAFRAYIEERILWTRSVHGSVIPTVGELTAGATWLLGGQPQDTAVPALARPQPIGSRWFEALGDMWPPRFSAVLVLMALLASLWARRMAVAGVKNAAAQVRRFSTDRMGLTLAVLPMTVILALPLPIAMLLGGLLLEATGPSVSRSLGAALLSVTPLALGLEIVRHMARPDGLAESHFRWRREGLVHLRRLVFLLEAAMLPPAIVASAFAQLGDTPMGDGIGRLCFIASQLLLATFFAWALAPWLPLVRTYLAKRGGSLSQQTRWLWYLLIVAAPLTLAVLATLGYYYTASQLDQRLQLTAWLLVAITVGYNLVLRWLFIERRRLLLKRAQQKREAEKADQPTGGGEVEGIELETPAELDAAEVDTQTRRVLTAAVLVSIVLGVYSLWTEQMPALRMLDRVQVYPSIRFQPAEAATIDTPGASVLLAPMLEGDATAPPRESQTSQTQSASPFLPDTTTVPREPIRNITLADIGGAIIFFALTWILARNLPGLLEITVLKRLPLDAGARFAVTSILRYIIGIFGIFLAFGAIGIGWSQVQFLAAALTFGLAFGLQEIFANFISGLIILVERPVRVGDTVTVGGINGRVTRIRMRATTVLDWELRELIIPNKVFITDQFINWTLSDPRIRLTITVGTAYGSDVRLVMRTLQEIGLAQEHVVAEPRVRVVFAGFGDNTLNFELRVYLEHFDYFIDTRNDLNVRIAERFAELGIEIAFPQRDLHIRSIGPLAEFLTPRQPQTPHE